MLTLRRGDRGNDVAQMQERLDQAGYAVGVADGIFGAITDRAVRAFQDAQGLPVDGAVGPQTWRTLLEYLDAAGKEVTDVVNPSQEVLQLHTSPPRTPLDHRINDAIHLQQRCNNGQGCRYGGWINPYQFDKKEFDVGQKFIIPKVGRIVPGNRLDKPIHGGTCSPWAGLMLGWLLCANEDYNFRIGRSAYNIANFDHDKVYKNSTIPGFADYCEVEGRRRLEKLPLNALYRHWDWLNKINFVEMDHHCILVLKVGGPDGLCLMDPRVGDAGDGAPLGPGLYRWAADGFYPKKDVDGDGKPEKFYSGTRQSFRRITNVERVGQGWDVYRIADLDPNTCAPVDGPWAGRTPWELALEE